MCIGGFCLDVCLCTTIPRVCSGEKISDLLELKLRSAISHYVYYVVDGGLKPCYLGEPSVCITTEPSL